MARGRGLQSGLSLRVGQTPIQALSQNTYMRTVLREPMKVHLAAIAKKYEELVNAQGAAKNPFELVYQDRTNQAIVQLNYMASSMLGSLLESYIRKFAHERFGDDYQPHHRGLGVKASEALPIPNHKRTSHSIWTRADHSVASQLASNLVGRVHRGELNGIGSKEFAKELARSRAILRSEGSLNDGELWSTEVDLMVKDPSIGIVEIKSSGRLDSTKAAGEATKLVLAGLVASKHLPLNLGISFVPVHGKKMPYQTLKKYFADDGIIVGQELWSRVIPSPYTYDDFINAYEKERARARKIHQINL